MSFKKQFGDFGEKKAERYLRSRGYSIVAKQYRTRRGEIDLIAENRRFLVFCEVKTRTGAHSDFGFPFEAITARKISRIKKAAEYYLLNFPTIKQIRFDVFSLSMQNSRLFLHHIENAF